MGSSKLILGYRFVPYIQPLLIHTFRYKQAEEKSQRHNDNKIFAAIFVEDPVYLTPLRRFKLTTEYV